MGEILQNSTLILLKFLLVETTALITVVYAREYILHETGRGNVRVLSNPVWIETQGPFGLWSFLWKNSCAGTETLRVDFHIPMFNEFFHN